MYVTDEIIQQNHTTRTIKVQKKILEAKLTILTSHVKDFTNLLITLIILEIKG